MQTDPDIAAGQSARRSGRYDVAVASFQRAAARPDQAAEAGLLEFRALREVDISRHLIGRLLRRVGMPAARYKGFAAIDPPLGVAAVADRMRALASQAQDDFPRHIQEADRLIRDEPGTVTPPADDLATDLGLRVARARRELRHGRAGEALAQLAASQSNAAPSAEAQAILGMGLWRAGERSAAANAFTLSLLYLDGTSSQGLVAFQTAYKDFRIVFCQGQFYAIPAWRDPILDASHGETKVVVHRLPRWLRYGVRRYLPRRVIAILQSLLSMTSLRGELPLDQLVHAPDLITLLRTVDRLRTTRR